MVGRVTLVTQPADAVSGPGTGCASGAAPGHIGICVCPAAGCQAVVCANTAPDTGSRDSAEIQSLMSLLRIWCSVSVVLSDRIIRCDYATTHWAQLRRLLGIFRQWVAARCRPLAADQCSRKDFRIAVIQADAVKRY